jgi:hypothetical protein
MGDMFKVWSEVNLGQWHYVLGYLIVLTSHNWPIMLALMGCLCFGCWAYRHPSRLSVNWLLTALLLGLVYEYDKHLAPELHAAVDFLFHLELSALNRLFHTFVGSFAITLLKVAWVAMLIQSLRVSLTAWRARARQGDTLTIDRA